MKKESCINFRWKNIFVTHTDTVLAICLESTPNFVED